MTTPAGAVAGNAEETQRQTRDPKGGSFFQRKYGPLPGWGWAAVAGVLAVGYFWWRNRSQAQGGSANDTSSADTSGTSDAADSPTSDQLASLQEEIDALQGQVATDTTQDTGGDTGGNPPPGVKTTVPKVTGLRVSTAITKLTAAGLKHKTSFQRKPGVAYKVKSQHPAAGAKVTPGSTVDLTIERVHPRK